MNRLLAVLEIGKEFEKEIIWLFENGIIESILKVIWLQAPLSRLLNYIVFEKSNAFFVLKDGIFIIT